MRCGGRNTNVSKRVEVELKLEKRIRVHGVVKALAFPALFVLWCNAGPQSKPPVNGDDRGSYRISVDVDLVVLPASVRDRQGREVSDLQENNFKVYEDGVAQRIQLFRHEDIPVIAGLLIDHSGSMQPKLAEVTAATRAFVHSSNPDDQMFVVNFNETVSLGLPEAIRFTSSAGELERAIWRSPAAGQTALYDAILGALEHMQTGSRDKKVLIVVSDGGDNASKHSLSEALKITEQSNAVIYTIGLFEGDDPDANPRVLSRLAQATGGEAFFPEKLDEVAPICERIARDIRSQYSIGYVSSNVKRDGVYRAIRVAAQAPGHSRLSVRTRRGYVAGGQLSRRQDADEK